MVYNQPFEDYQRDEAINSGGLKEMMRSPAHYIASRQKALAEQKTKESVALGLGRVTHVALLEPYAFGKHAIVRPKFDLRTKQGKIDAKAWDASLPDGAIEVEEAWMATLQGMLESIHAHPVASNLLSNSADPREASLYWDDEEHRGIRCKARFDLISNGVPIDVKSCLDASRSGFAKAIWKFRYDIQVAHYLTGAAATQQIDPDVFIFIAVEKEPPYAVGVHYLSERSVGIGKSYRDGMMRRYAECRASGDWPAYDTDDSPLELPAWAQEYVDDK